MATVKSLIKNKGHQVWSVPPTATTLAALRLLKEKEIGALLVLNEGNIVGIVSERDIVRRIAEISEFDPDADVEEYMTRKVFVVHPDQSLEECMQMMTQEHIRHLPVVDNDQLVGLISIGDLVKELIHDKESMIISLENYIQGQSTEYGH